MMVLLGCLLTWSSCTDLDGVNSRLDKVEKEVSDLQTALETLQKAQDEAKVIKELTPVESVRGGWNVVFSDDTSILVLNGEEGVTPYLKVDQDGYVAVSYDNCKTFSRLKDNAGNDILAADVSMKVTVNGEGYYVFQEYSSSDSSELIDEIVSPYTYEKSHLIKMISENEKTHIVTLTLDDGTDFTFAKSYAYPTSIAILTTQTLYLSKGATTTVEFRVNPQTALFEYDVNSENCQIQLDKVGTSRAASYVTAPTGYKLEKVEQCYDGQGVLKQGQYKATLKDEGKGTAYDDQVAFVISATDEDGNPVLVSSSAFRVKYSDNTITSFSFSSKKNSAVLKDIVAAIEGNDITVSSPYITDATELVADFESSGDVYVGNVPQKSGVSSNDFTNGVTYKVVSNDGEVNTYQVKVAYSGLPVVEISTPDGVQITSKDNWVKNVGFKIIKTDGSVDCEGTMQMKGRGNSTWTYPKKPYAIKLDSKSNVLGLAKEKRFDLLANWMDRTLLRNDVTYHIARQTTSMGWNPKGEFVEVVLNGNHIGNYYLCEHIKVGENRVNITELDEDATSGEEVTGGYLMELDVYYDEECKFKSARYNMPYMFKDPDEVNDAQLAYLQGYVNQMEEALYDDAKFASREYLDYMDIDSYIDWWFVHEIAKNGEPNWPKSTYMHKDKNGKMVAGPVWDFDWGTYASTENWSVKGALYYGRLFQDAAFVQTVKNRWAAQKSTFEAVAEYIRQKGKNLEHSDELNIGMWPISSRVNGDETMSYSDAVQRMYDNYKGRIAWLNSAINAL